MDLEKLKREFWAKGGKIKRVEEAPRQSMHELSATAAERFFARADDIGKRQSQHEERRWRERQLEIAERERIIEDLMQDDKS